MTDVVVLKTARKPTPEWVETVRTKLTLGPEEKLTIVTLRSPAAALAVDAVLAISPSARPFRRPRSHQVASKTSAPVGPASGEDFEDLSKNPQGETTPARASLPSRIVSKGKRIAGRVVNRLTPSLQHETYFAIGCATSRRVLHDVKKADLVIAADVGTFRAAWLLSRLRKQPAFIAWVDGGAKWMADR